MKEWSGDPWPGPDDKLIVAQMLADPSSHHWNECHTFFEHVIRANNLPVDLRDDVVQNAMFTVMRSLPTFHYECRLRTWLGMIANSRIVDAWRNHARKNRQIIPLDNPPGDEESGTGILKINAPQTTEGECIIREELREAISVLREYLNTHAKSERNRQILQKVLLEEYTFEEAAQELGVNAPVIRYVVRSVQRYLRERMGP